MANMEPKILFLGALLLLLACKALESFATLCIKQLHTFSYIAWNLWIIDAISFFPVLLWQSDPVARIFAFFLCEVLATTRKILIILTPSHFPGIYCILKYGRESRRREHCSRSSASQSGSRGKLLVFGRKPTKEKFYCICISSWWLQDRQGQFDEWPDSAPAIKVKDRLGDQLTVGCQPVNHPDVRYTFRIGRPGLFRTGWLDYPEAENLRLQGDVPGKTFTRTVYICRRQFNHYGD